VTDPRTDTDAAARPRHDERLRPAGWVWAGAAVLSVSAGVILVPLTTAAALPVTAVVAVLLAVALVRTSPRVRVDASGLQAGRARLPWSAVGEIAELDRTRMRAELGVDLNALAHLCIRGWVPGGIKVEVVDDADPTPYWLVSSRRPAALAAALTERPSPSRP
jgi:Protein of unknown function (DUF3093)